MDYRGYQRLIDKFASDPDAVRATWLIDPGRSLPLPLLPDSAYPPGARPLPVQLAFPPPSWRVTELEEQLEKAQASARRWQETATALEEQAHAADVYQRRADILQRALADITSLFVTDPSGWARSVCVSLDDLSGWLALARKRTDAS